MRHGFKTQAERLSVQARRDFALLPTSPLDPRLYAQRIGVTVLDFNTLDLSAHTRKHLLVIDGESWSALTIKDGGVTAIIVNPSHSSGRQSSSLMHELAHIILKHVPGRVDVSTTGMLLLSHYSEDAEAEADWLAAAMLLPREALIARRRKGQTIATIAAAFGTSEQLCEWRVRMTGVDVQLRRAHHY